MKNIINQEAKITEGKFKGLKGTIVAEVKDMDKYMIKLDEFNAIYVDKKDCKIIEKEIKKEFEYIGGKYKAVTHDDYVSIYKIDCNKHIKTYIMDVPTNKSVSLEICINKFKNDQCKEQIQKLIDESKQLESFNQKLRMIAEDEKADKSLLNFILYVSTIKNKSKYKENITV